MADDYYFGVGINALKVDYSSAIARSVPDNLSTTKEDDNGLALFIGYQCDELQFKQAKQLLVNDDLSKLEVALELCYSCG